MSYNISKELFEAVMDFDNIMEILQDHYDEYPSGRCEKATAELKQVYIDGLNSHHQAMLGLLKRRMEAKGTTHEERCVLQEVYESIGGMNEN